MTITSTDFVVMFPEFNSVDVNVINQAINITTAINCGFMGLLPAQRTYACGLDVASWLYQNVSLGQAGQSASISPNQQVLKVKSYDDEIAYAKNDSQTLFGSENIYQKALNTLIEQSYTGGVSSIGCFDYNVTFRGY